MDDITLYNKIIYNSLHYSFEPKTIPFLLKQHDYGLNSCFSWAKTKEGYDFWYKVAITKNLCNSKIFHEFLLKNYQDFPFINLSWFYE